MLDPFLFEYLVVVLDHPQNIRISFLKLFTNHSVKGSGLFDGVFILLEESYCALADAVPVVLVHAVAEGKGALVQLQQVLTVGLDPLPQNVKFYGVTLTLTDVVVQ